MNAFYSKILHAVQAISVVRGFTRGADLGAGGGGDTEVSGEVCSRTVLLSSRIIFIFSEINDI